MKFWCMGIFRKSVIKIVQENGSLLEDVGTFLIISPSVLLRTRNVSYKSCTENQNTHFTYNPPPRPTARKSGRPSLWEKVEKYGRAERATHDNIIRRMRFACWKTKAADTHSECVILAAFPQQKMVTRTRLDVTFIFVHTYIFRLVKP
jgi:hypothetical protein